MLSESEEQYQGKVFVVDTNGVSVVLQREVQKIAALIADGKTGSEIQIAFKEISKEFFGYIVPKSLETLKRGGRITPAAASLAKLLKIVPVLSYDGMIDKGFTARTFKKAINETLDQIKKHYKNNVKIIDVAHSRCEPENMELIEKLIEKAGLTIGIKAELPNVISAHTGRNTFALVA
jgi:DegV family protein with EDD domain